MCAANVYKLCIEVQNQSLFRIWLSRLLYSVFFTFFPFGLLTFSLAQNKNIPNIWHVNVPHSDLDAMPYAISCCQCLHRCLNDARIRTVHTQIQNISNTICVRDTSISNVQPCTGGAPSFQQCKREPLQAFLGLPNSFEYLFRSNPRHFGLCLLDGGSVQHCIELLSKHHFAFDQH